jgi:hypothetical protein
MDDLGRALRAESERFFAPIAAMLGAFAESHHLQIAKEHGSSAWNFHFGLRDEGQGLLASPRNRTTVGEALESPDRATDARWDCRASTTALIVRTTDARGNFRGNCGGCQAQCENRCAG